MFQLSDIFYFTLQSYSAHSPEITGLKLELKFFYLLFLAVSGSGIINPDPGKSSGSNRIRIQDTAFMNTCSNK